MLVHFFEAIFFLRWNLSFNFLVDIGVSCLGVPISARHGLSRHLWRFEPCVASPLVTRRMRVLSTGHFYQSVCTQLPSLKLTPCPWKSMVGKWYFLFGWPIFRGKLLLVSGDRLGRYFQSNNRYRHRSSVISLQKGLSFVKGLATWFFRLHFVCGLDGHFASWPQPRRLLTGNLHWFLGNNLR